MITKLVKLANTLDQKGYYKLADELDLILKLAIEEWRYHGFSSPEEYKRHRGLRAPEEIQKEPEEIKNLIDPDGLCDGCGKSTETVTGVYGDGFEFLPKGFKLRPEIENTDPPLVGLCGECDEKVKRMIQEE